jgi:hypothetical protein
MCDARPLHIMYIYMLLITKAGSRFCFERCNSCLLFSGWNALTLSFIHGHLEICKLLVQCQAHVDVQDKVRRRRQYFSEDDEEAGAEAPLPSSDDD